MKRSEIASFPRTCSIFGISTSLQQDIWVKFWTAHAFLKKEPGQWLLPDAESPDEQFKPLDNYLIYVRAPLKTAAILRPLPFYVRIKCHFKNEFCNISLSRTTSRSDAVLDSTSKEKKLVKIEIYFMAGNSKVKRLRIMIYLSLAHFGQNLLLVDKYFSK